MMTHISHLLTLGLLLLPLTIVPLNHDTENGSPHPQQWGFLRCGVDNGPCRLVGPYSSREDAEADTDAVKYPYYATKPTDWTELVDGGGEAEQPQQQTTTINSEAVAIAVDYHAALLLACSDLIHRKDLAAVDACAKNYVARIIHDREKHEGKEQRE